MKSKEFYFNDYCVEGGMIRIEGWPMVDTMHEGIP